MLDTEAPECEDQAEGLLPPNQQLTIGVHEHDASSDGSSWYSGMGIKGIVLGLFVLQASSYVLLRRYSLGVWPLVLSMMIKPSFITVPTPCHSRCAGCISTEFTKSQMSSDSVDFAF